MSKTDTVAPFSLIFARKVRFSENSSVCDNFCKNWPKPFLVKDHDAARCAWKGGCTGQRQVRAWCARAWCAAVLWATVLCRSLAFEHQRLRSRQSWGSRARARRAWLGRRVDCSAHIMCSRVLSLCAVLQSLRRSHASQAKSVQATAYGALGCREVCRHRRTGRECY